MGQLGLRLGCAERAALVAVLVVVGFVGCARYVSRPPERAFVAEQLTFGRNLVAYEVLDGTPQVVFRRDARVIFDHLKLDWISIEFPPTPPWQLTGNFIGINATTDPAGLGVASCWPDSTPRRRAEAPERCDGPAVLFGQILDQRIVSFEILDDNGWQTRAVAAPGFIVRFDDLDGEQEARWLDEAGAVIWQADVP